MPGITEMPWFKRLFGFLDGSSSDASQNGSSPAGSPAATRSKAVAKVLVLYYSTYGHVEALANAVRKARAPAGRMRW